MTSILSIARQIPLILIQLPCKLQTTCKGLFSLTLVPASASCPVFSVHSRSMGGIFRHVLVHRKDEICNAKNSTRLIQTMSFCTRMSEVLSVYLLLLHLILSVACFYSLTPLSSTSGIGLAGLSFARSIFSFLTCNGNAESCNILNESSLISCLVLANFR